MFSKNRPLFIVLGGGFLFCLDRILKWLSLNLWTDNVTIKNLFGWQPFLNKNAAFSAPLPNIIILLIAIPTLALIIFLLIQTIKNSGNGILAYSLVFFGGLSNLLDRAFNNATTDYFLIFTGVINLADLMILAGFVLLIFKKTKLAEDNALPDNFLK